MQHSTRVCEANNNNDAVGLVALARRIVGNDGSVLTTYAKNRPHWMVVTAITPFWVSRLPAQAPTRMPVTMQSLENLLQ